MYSRTRPTVYLVHWPEINVFKVGYSDFQRYRTFTLRGANLIDTKQFDSIDDGLNFEKACHYALRDGGCSPAFRQASEAVEYLGSEGAGYSECFRLPADLTAPEIPQYIDAMLAAWIA